MFAPFVKVISQPWQIRRERRSSFRETKLPCLGAAPGIFIFDTAEDVPRTEIGDGPHLWLNCSTHICDHPARHIVAGYPVDRRFSCKSGRVHFIYLRTGKVLNSGWAKDFLIGPPFTVEKGWRVQNSMCSPNAGFIIWFIRHPINRNKVGLFQ